MATLNTKIASFVLAILLNSGCKESLAILPLNFFWVTKSIAPYFPLFPANHNWLLSKTIALILIESWWISFSVTFEKDFFTFSEQEQINIGKQKRRIIFFIFENLSTNLQLILDISNNIIGSQVELTCTENGRSIVTSLI